MNRKSKILVIGEVIFDHFQDGRTVLGGAPFNVAWNLQGLGQQPRLITAVGDDEDGRVALEKMTQWGMDNDGVQKSENYPTGQARVEVHDGEPRFVILDEQAYDEINQPENIPKSGDYELLYVGSLAFRRDPSRSTIRRFMNESGIPKFVDINIRQPWYTDESGAELLQDATWTKLNSSELSFITGMPCSTQEEIVAAVANLRRTFSGKQYFITCGSDGAIAVDESGIVTAAGSKSPNPFVDSVGAGDAFSAAAIHSIVRGCITSEVLVSAIDFASRTCSIQGATTQDRTHYSS